MALNKDSNIGLRRTASEIKRYRVLMRLIPSVMGFFAMILTIVYVVSILYSKYGSFTVRVQKFDYVKYSLSLSETPDFKAPISRLNSKAAKEVTNIDGDTLPPDLNEVNGEHNGDNYVAYTFYCKNTGTQTVTYEYMVYIANMTNGIERAARVRLYVSTATPDEEGNAVFGDPTITDYARTASDGSGPEPGTIAFLTEGTVCREQVVTFKPGDMTKFTVVIWLEGNDPDCLDHIIGGEFKMDMQMSIIGVEDPDTGEMVVV